MHQLRREVGNGNPASNGAFRLRQTHPQFFFTAPLPNWIQNNPSIMPPELLFQEGAPMIYPMCGVVCCKRSLDCPSMTTCSIKEGRGEGGAIR